MGVLGNKVSEKKQLKKENVYKNTLIELDHGSASDFTKNQKKRVILPIQVVGYKHLLHIYRL